MRGWRRTSSLSSASTTRTLSQVRGWFDDLWDEASPSTSPRSTRPASRSTAVSRSTSGCCGSATATSSRKRPATERRRSISRRSRRRPVAGTAYPRGAPGVLIADEVGLGKTFLAGELIREAVERASAARPPGRTRDLARRTVAQVPLDFSSGSSASPSTTSRPGNTRYSAEEYAMVVVDEAHNLRNPAPCVRTRFAASLAGTPPKDLVLLTATPVNNSLWDLYYLLAYFLKNDSVFAEPGSARCGPLRGCDGDRPGRPFAGASLRRARRRRCPTDQTVREAVLPERQRDDRRHRDADHVPEAAPLKVEL